MQQTKKEDGYINLDDFIELGSKYIPNGQLKNEIETYMTQAKPIDFNKVKLISEFQLYFSNDIPKIKLINENDLKKI